MRMKLKSSYVINMVPIVLRDKLNLYININRQWEIRNRITKTIPVSYIMYKDVQ